MSQPLSKLGQAYVSFASYHLNSVNRWIHVFTTPILIASFIAILNFIPLSLQLGKHTIGVADMVIIAALIYYASLSLVFTAGLVMIGIGIAIAWQEIFKGMDHESYVKWVLILHLCCWISSVIIGHGIFEKRRPQIMETFCDSLSLPLFSVVNICYILRLKSAEMEDWRAHIRNNAAALRKKDNEE